MPGTRNDQRDDQECRFAALYQAYYHPILAYAVRRVEAAEDAADVFTTAWRRIDELPEAPADRLWGNNMLPAGTVMQYTEYVRAGVVKSVTRIPR